MTPEERFQTKLRPLPNGCIEYTAAIDDMGYGIFALANGKPGGKKIRAHVMAWTLANGPVPTGLVVDHKCHNEDPECQGGNTCLHRRCANAEHLQVTTKGQNLRNSPLTTTSKHAAKTCCPEGHPYDSVRSDGSRCCRQCRRARDRRRYAEENPVARRKRRV